MLITIDASRALVPQPTGIEIYSREIIGALLALPEAKDHRWLLLAPQLPPIANLLAQLPNHARWEIIPGQRLWTWWHLSQYFLRNRETNQSTLFVPGHILPPIAPKHSIITIHDFAFRWFPETYGNGRRWWLDAELARSARKATHIIVPSAATAIDLTHFYDIPRDRITIVHHGIDHKEHSFQHKEVTKSSVSNNTPYLLFIGRIEPRKNIGRLVTAFERVCQKLGEPLNLVLIGRQPADLNRVIPEFAELKPATRQRIILPGYQTEEQVKIWLKYALGFVFPSLYEGFGFPVLEAMRQGIPVITSKTSALGEIADQAALLVDPENIEELTTAMTRLVQDLVLRESLKQAGQTRAQEFTWHKAAQTTLSILTGT